MPRPDEIRAGNKSEGRKRYSESESLAFPAFERTGGKALVREVIPYNTESECTLAKFRGPAVTRPAFPFIFRKTPCDDSRLGCGRRYDCGESQII